MIAKRIHGFGELDATIMCYWKTADGTWLLYIPRCGLGDLRKHQVIEHEDGTITVTPSILVTGHDAGKETTVHGFLTNGVWRVC